MSPLTGSQLRQKFLDFYTARGHVVIPPALLVPENDPTTLFTSSGMQPLVPYLLGETHPSGTRLVDAQPCIRMEDIDEVADNRHQTFFEMLGNWSLGDYFKKEQLRWVFNFLTEEVGLDTNKLYVSVFIGDKNNHISKDEESIKIWKELFSEKGIDAKYVELFNEGKGGELGMQGGRIFAYDVKKNWWSRSGIPANMPVGEIGGPDSEVFYEFTQVKHNSAFGKHCHPNCDCGRYLEVGNSVFIQFQKQEDGSFKPLPHNNVDFGGGLERILSALNNDPDSYRIDIFWPIIEALEKLVDKKYEKNQETFRVIADHMKASVIMISQGLEPSNKQQGYVLRRLLRRAAVKLSKLDNTQKWNSTELIKTIVKPIINIYQDIYLNETRDLERVSEIIISEFTKFTQTLIKGVREIEKQDIRQINGIFAFNIWQTYGFPIELTKELVEERGGSLNKQDFDQEFAKHQKLSRTASAGMFKGGLADQSENTIKYHTATHLLHQALRQVLGDHVQQKGSNITGERLRFDFSHPQALTVAEIQSVEHLINKTITQDLPVHVETLPYQEAVDLGAHSFFTDRYPEKVKVYTIGKSSTDYFSKEICGGPHVQHTAQIGLIKIIKETSAGSNLRRIYTQFI